MPPLPLAPSRPLGSPDIVPSVYGGGGYDASSNYAGGSMTNAMQPGGAGVVTPDQWAQYIETLKQAYQASSGFERTRLKAQYDDAEKGRQNALQIARLQADNSRYGTDVGRQTEIDRLKENARQFDANHGLDVRKADLDEAQLIATQRSQPNRLFQTMDLEQALTGIRSGQRATTMPMTTGIAAVDGLSTDYRGNPYLRGGDAGGREGTGYGGDPTAGAGSVLNGASAGGPSGTGMTTGVQMDPRVKAIKGIVDALPPSATEGLDSTGVAALNAAFALYHAPTSIRPGTLESLSPTQQATFKSAGDRLQRYTGLSSDDLMDRYYRQAPGQGRANAA